MGHKMKRVCARLVFLGISALIWTGCPNQTGSTSASGTVNGLIASSTTTANSSNITAFQIITRVGASGSFNSAVVPISGGVSLAAARLFDLNGTQISSTNVPAWFVSAHAFLTSTRTSAGSPTYAGADTACAYFDSYGTDNNPDSSGYYTIDGYNVTATGVSSDIDQCAGTAAAELNQLGMYLQFDRRFMNSNDKLEIIIKAMPIDEPNTAPTASSCVVGGNFNAANCSNQVFTLTRRTSPGAAAKPFFNLFPSAKALDLLSESVLVPLADDTSITTLSIDRVKGGAVFYGITVIKMQ